MNNPLYKNNREKFIQKNNNDASTIIKEFLINAA